MAPVVSRGGSHTYATLILSDSYLPGALVLAHSLRDAGTTKPLVVLVTLDSVSVETITQLKATYDHVIAVPRIRNSHPANLYLMNRADLHSAFTKINLWKQTQFSKIVYLDADVLAHRAPDELFDLPHSFSAAPDIGWPDLFNTGVMVLTPNMGDYYAMLAMADRGISFDGADQGLLNMHFKNEYNRLGFTYNVTPSAHYQYVPAYRHFQSSISMVHFIGASKPWFASRNAPHGNSPYDEMVGRWWSVYDRHYRAKEGLAPGATQYPSRDDLSSGRSAASWTKLEEQQWQQHHPQDGAGQVEASHGSSQPSSYPSLSSAPPSAAGPCSQPHFQTSHDDVSGGSGPYVSQTSSTNESVDESFGAKAEARPAQVSEPTSEGEGSSSQEHRHEARPITMHDWDAQRHPPPVDSKPEAMNFPSTHYDMSQDVTPFVPPERYPSPPRNMWYEVPKDAPTPPSHKPRPIFPWESHQPRPSRTFHDQGAIDAQNAAQLLDPDRPLPTATPGQEAESPATVSTTADTKSESSGQTTPMPHADPWSSFPRINAWDNVPEIGRYMEGLQQPRRGNNQGLAAGYKLTQSGFQSRGRAQGLRLTDFPSEVDRPSLPVTPAPIARPSFWGDDKPGLTDLGGGGAKKGSRTAPLPAAEGVPAQSEWDPSVQLEKLAREQSEALLRKLSNDASAEDGGFAREIPLRPLPFGSDGTASPTRFSQQEQAEMLSPQPIKPGNHAVQVLQSKDLGGEPAAISEPS